MKFLDEVKIVKNLDKYSKFGVTYDLVGTIIESAIRDECFEVVFSSKNAYDDDIIIPIKIEDLELVEDKKCPDDQILDDLPKHNPKWWCKVEDGFIKNLLGEKKNKIPYDYNS